MRLNLILMLTFCCALNTCQQPPDTYCRDGFVPIGKYCVAGYRP